MHMVFDPGMIVRVIASTKQAGRIYLGLVDVKGEGAKFDFSVDNAVYTDLLAEQNQLKHIEGDFTSYQYQPEGKPAITNWKANNLVIKPYKP